MKRLFSRATVHSAGMQKKKNNFIHFWLAMLLIPVVVLLVIELAVRDYSAGFANMILKQGGDLVQHHFHGLYVYDPYLGWVPKPAAAAEKWGTVVHTLGDGIRSNGNTRVGIQGKEVILVLGDSYAFGDEVADNQTWPAVLEEISSYQVLNAAVSSYGIDQIVLRGEKLLEKYHPDIVIVSFIFETLDRIDESVRHGVPKPYFVLENGQLVLRNVPIRFKEDVKLDWFRRIFGYSHLVHLVMDRLFPEYWWKDTMYDIRYVQEGQDDSFEIVEMLLKKIVDAAGENTKVIFLAQAGVNVNETHNYFIVSLLSRVQEYAPRKSATVNLLSELMELKKNNPQEFIRLYNLQYQNPHLSAKGNEFVAQRLKEALAGLGTPQP